MAGRSVVASLLRELCAHTGDVNYCDWSPTDQTLATCSGDKTVRLWRADDGQELPNSPISAHAYYVNACVYSPGGDLLATASSDSTVKLWTTATWATVGSLVGHEEAVRHCCFSPDGNLLATASADCSARVWEVASLRCIATLTRYESSVTCCGFAPNGWLLATGGSSGDLILFDVFSRRVVAKILGHDLGVNTLAISPLSSQDVLVMATGGNDNTVRVWNVTANKSGVQVNQVRELTGHSGHVYSCCYSPDGALLSSASADKNFILWDLETGRPLHTVAAHSRYMTHCSFSPDGKLLVTASRTVKVWSIHPPDTKESWKAEPSVKDTTMTTTTKSRIAGENWKVEDVCKWADTVGQQLPPHEEDTRAVDRLCSVFSDLTTSTKQDQKTPDDFICPVTQERFKDPVVAADGYTYERSAIMEWLSKGRRSSPVTNLPLPNTLLIPNRHLKAMLDRKLNTTTLVKEGNKDRGTVAKDK